MDDVHLISATPVVDTSIYASGDAMHAAQMQFDVSNFRDAGGFVLDQVMIADKDKEAANVDLVLFSATVANQTINTAFAPTDTELATIVAVVSLTTHVAFSDNGLTYARDLGIPIKLPKSSANQILYGFLVARATPTYTAAADLKVTLGLRAAR